jgi:hypothetical protein
VASADECNGDVSPVNAVDSIGVRMTVNRPALMCFFRFLVISLLTSASIAAATAQTEQQIKQLPRGCAYIQVPVLENPFPHPAEKNAINMTRVVTPRQFRAHNLPLPGMTFFSPLPLFPEPPSGFTMICGLHPHSLRGFE